LNFLYFAYKYLSLIVMLMNWDRGETAASGASTKVYQIDWDRRHAQRSHCLCL